MQELIGMSFGTVLESHFIRSISLKENKAEKDENRRWVVDIAH
jgi:hypothetical protein